MFINPKTAIEKGWIKGITDEKKQIQPNAIDFTLDEVWSVNVALCAISEDGKQMRGGGKIQPVPARNGSGNFWHLGYGIYDCLSDMYVEVPDGVAAMLVTRSTFARNGIFLTSGLYDSGFKGRIGFTLHVQPSQVLNGLENPHNTVIGVNTRVGQIIFVEASSAGLYTGGYNHAAGTVAPHMKNNDL